MDIELFCLLNIYFENLISALYQKPSIANRHELRESANTSCGKGLANNHVLASYFNLSIGFQEYKLKCNVCTQGAESPGVEKGSCDVRASYKVGIVTKCSNLCTEFVRAHMEILQRSKLNKSKCEDSNRSKTEK